MKLHLLLLALTALVAAVPQDIEAESEDLAPELVEGFQAQLDAQEIQAEVFETCSSDSQCTAPEKCRNTFIAGKRCVAFCNPAQDKLCPSGDFCYKPTSLLDGICLPGCKTNDDCGLYQTCTDFKNVLVLGQVGSCKNQCDTNEECATTGEFCNASNKCELECNLTDKPCAANNHCVVTEGLPNKCEPGCLTEANCNAGQVCVKAKSALVGTCKSHQCTVDGECPTGKYCKSGLVRTCVPGCRKSTDCKAFAGGKCTANRQCAYPSCSPAYDRCANGFYCHATHKKCKAGCKAKNSPCKTADNKNGKCNAQHVCVAIPKKKGDACKTNVANDCGNNLKCIAARKGYTKGVCHPVVGLNKTCHKGLLYAVCSTGLKCKKNKCKA